MKDIAAVLVVLAVVASVIFGVWAHFKAPCEDFKWLSAKDVPARCLVLKN